ncbi:MAG: hypothetical protein VKJ46_01460 [Leptolyngbyaceae bacterium]|nr:hypothetical protein [Leptolyngbyaceae bacterium]
MTLEIWTDDRLERLAGALEMNTQITANLAHGQKRITDIIERLATSQADLADSQAQLARIVERIDAKLDSTTAAVERLERIVDYLLRRDAEKNVEEKEGD